MLEPLGKGMAEERDRRGWQRSSEEEEERRQRRAARIEEVRSQLQKLAEMRGLVCLTDNMTLAGAICADAVCWEERAE